jgi:hypothetical protein
MPLPGRPPLSRACESGGIVHAGTSGIQTRQPAGAANCSDGVSFMVKKHSPKILLYQSAGFLAIIALSYLDDWLGLSSLVFGDHPLLPEFHQSSLEMLLILAVWYLVAASTRRVLDRMRELEDFLKVCAWCRRIEHQGEWISLESFLKLGFDTTTTHGICPNCLEREKAEAERVRQRAGKLNPGLSA